MKRFIIRKTFASLIVFVTVIIIIFFINVCMPGNITNSQQAFFLPKEQKLAIRKKLHLDESKTVQLKYWAKGLFDGTLGYSYANGRPVTEIIKAPFTQTVKLCFSSFLLSLLIAIPIGVLSSTKQYSFADYLFTTLALIGISLPAFAFASILKRIFLFNVTVFDLFAKYKHIDFKEYHRIMTQDILPFVVVTIINLATLTRYARSSMLEVVRQEYIKTAKSKGLSDYKVYYKHALKNSLILLLTIIGLLIPGLLTSTLFVEMVLGSRGLGSMLISSVFNRDYGLMMGISIIVSAITIFSNYIVDIAYAFIDPRVRLTK